MLFQVYSDRLDPGKGWYVLNEELHVSALRKHKENSFFRLFPDEVKMVPFCELNDMAAEILSIQPCLVLNTKNATC